MARLGAKAAHHPHPHPRRLAAAAEAKAELAALHPAPVIAPQPEAASNRHTAEVATTAAVQPSPTLPDLVVRSASHPSTWPLQPLPLVVCGRTVHIATPTVIPTASTMPAPMTQATPPCRSRVCANNTANVAVTTMGIRRTWILLSAMAVSVL